MTTPNIGLTELSNSAGQYLNANETFAVIDALLQTRAVSQSLTAAPGSPSDGDVYIMASAWAGITTLGGAACAAGDIALYRTGFGAFKAIRPKEGWKIEVAADDQVYRFDGAAWLEFGGGGGVSLPAVRAITANESLGLAQINTVGVNSTTSNYTVTIQPQASVTWTADAELHFLPDNTGDITITAAAGVSLNGVVAGSVTLSTQHGAASLKRKAADSWWVGGALGTLAEQRAALGVPDSFGNRNRLINGNFGVNQRAVSGSVVLAAGAYGHDRWKAGASGCTYTFATSNNVTTLTITAGSLQQVIEGVNLQSGTHTLSWSGTAQGKLDGGGYSASGVTGTGTGGTNMTVEFNTGTLSLVQLEFGSVVTPFEHRYYGAELSLCQRYYQVLYGSIRGFAGIASIQHSNALSYKVNMRATPTASVSTTEYEARSAILGEPLFFGNNTSDGRFEITTSTGGEFYALQNKVTLSAEL